MTTFWTWASIIGLSMTPNLILGPSIAVGVGIAAHYDPWILVPVVAAAGYVEGLIVAWLAGESTHIGFIDRWVTRMRTPRSVDIANSWGVWGGLTFGCALVGQEPILVALRWLDVNMRHIWLPLAFSNAVFAVIYTQSYRSASTRSQISDPLCRQVPPRIFLAYAVFKAGNTTSAAL